MERRLQLWLGVSACALLGATVLPIPAFAQMSGGSGGQGQGNSQDIDPDGGMLHECGEPGGCAEAGESFESRGADEFGEDDDDQPALVTPTRPRSGNGGLSSGDSVRGGVNDGGLGD
ncbi:MAG: hypothetical protein ACREEP_12515 [Dongiaceae bacterium]